MPEDTMKPGWQQVRFGEVVRQVKDKIDPKTSGLDRYIAGEHMDTDDLRIHRWGTINDEYLGPAFHMRFKPGQVLYGSRRTYLRKVVVPYFEGVCANTTFVLEPKDPSVLLPEMLPFIMQTEAFHEHSIKQSRGSVNPYVNYSDLEWYEFGLPPVDEQEKFVDLAQSLDNLITEYTDAEISAEVTMSSFIHEVLRSSNAPTIQTRHLLSDEPKNGFSPPANSQGIGYRTVSISAISGGGFVPETNIKFVDVDQTKVKQFIVRKDDVFVVRGNGNRTLTGKAGIADRTFDDLFYPDLLIRLRFDETKIDPRFAVIEWNSRMVHNQLISRAKSTNGIWKINSDDIRKHALTVPSIEEQKRFLKDIEQIKDCIAHLKTRKQKISRMKSLLLKRLAC